VDTGRVDVEANIALRDLYKADVTISDENSPRNDGSIGVVDDEGKEGRRGAGNLAYVDRRGANRDSEASCRAVGSAAEDEGGISQGDSWSRVGDGNASAAKAKILVKRIVSVNRDVKILKYSPTP
jgi:hypothetical protein